jgi:hypothetical protein
MMGSKGSATISALSAFQRMVMMMRIIDAHLAQEIADREIGGETASLIQYVLSHTPTIEAEPVRHGRWECEFETYGKLRCSVCKKEALLETANDALYATSNYCPNCGAKMQGGSDE